MAHSVSTRSGTMTRREMLSAVSATSVLALTHMPSRAFAATLDVDALLSLSQNLVGQDDLSKDIAAAMLDAFSVTGQKEAISALADGKNDDAMANEIVAAWYTGVSPDPDDLDVITYTDALMWQAMDYTKPLAYCGGGMGYWAEPPGA